MLKDLWFSLILGTMGKKMIEKNYYDCKYCETTREVGEFCGCDGSVAELLVARGDDAIRVLQRLYVGGSTDLEELEVVINNWKNARSHATSEGMEHENL